MSEARQLTTSAVIEHLKWRYAAGEITLEQYEEMQRVLESKQTWD